LGPEIFVKAIKESTKGLSRTETLAVEAKILNDYFDEITGTKIKSFLNIGRLKPAIENLDTTLNNH
jgi:AraC-like DNA-binding protein